MDHVANAFLIGAPKAGTTSLAAALDQHPDVTVTRPKEPSTLLRDRSAWSTAYQQQFGGSMTRVRIDATTRYSVEDADPSIAQRISSLGADVKVLYVLRHPLDRIESHWRQIRSQQSGVIDKDFARAVVNDHRLVRGSCYRQTLEDFAASIPRSNIHVELFDRFERDPDAVVEECLAFLGLEAPVDEIRVRSLNGSAGKRQEPEWIRALRRVPAARRVAESTRTIGAAARVRNRLLQRIPAALWDDVSLEFARSKLLGDLEALQADWGLGLDWGDLSGPRAMKPAHP